MKSLGIESKQGRRGSGRANAPAETINQFAWENKASTELTQSLDQIGSAGASPSRLNLLFSAGASVSRLNVLFSAGASVSRLHLLSRQEPRTPGLV